VFLSAGPGKDRLARAESENAPERWRAPDFGQSVRGSGSNARDWVGALYHRLPERADDGLRTAGEE
jgi:hypothetical protein